MLQICSVFPLNRGNRIQTLILKSFKRINYPIEFLNVQECDATELHSSSVLCLTKTNTQKNLCSSSSMINTKLIELHCNQESQMLRTFLFNFLCSQRASHSTPFPPKIWSSCPFCGSPSKIGMALEISSFTPSILRELSWSSLLSQISVIQTAFLSLWSFPTTYKIQPLAFDTIFEASNKMEVSFSLLSSFAVNFP